MVYKQACKWLVVEWSKLTPEKLSDAKNPNVSQVHAISAALKPLIKWECMKLLQECREACGGHGYSQFARFGLWRDDYDVNLTWEGDNNVLIQQTTRWFLTAYQKGNFSKYDALKTFEQQPNEKFSRSNLLDALKWKVFSILEESVGAIGKEGITAWNDLQAICLRKLSLSLGEYFSALRM